MPDDVTGVDLSCEIFVVRSCCLTIRGGGTRNTTLSYISDPFGFSAAVARLCCIVVGFSCQPFVHRRIFDLTFPFSTSPMVRSLRLNTRICSFLKIFVWSEEVERSFQATDTSPRSLSGTGTGAGVSLIWRLFLHHHDSRAEVGKSASFVRGLSNMIGCQTTFQKQDFSTIISRLRKMLPHIKSS